MIRFSNATLARDAFDRDFEKAMALTIEPKAESTALRLLKLQIGEAFALGEQGRSTGSRGSPSVARNTRAAQKSSRPSCSTFDIDPTYRASSGPAPKPTEAQLARACGDGAVTFLREMRTGLQQMADAATQMCGGTATVSTPKNPFAANTFREGFNLFLLNIGQAQEQEARSNCIGGTMVGMVAIGTVVGLATSVKNALLASRPLEAVDALVGSKLDSWPCLNSKGRTQATCDFISRLAATYFTGKASGAFKLAGRGARKGLRVVQDSQIAAALKSTRSKFAKRAEPVKAPAAVAPKPLRITGGPEFQMRPVNKPNTRALQTYTEKTGVKVEVREFGYDRFIVESETNRGLFSLKYKLRTDPTTKEMYIHGIVAGVEQTPDKLGHRADLKGNGFYSHLMERMVRENPQARAIEAKLEYDNLAQINKMIKEGYSVEQAIRSTPSYRVYSENGFTQIDLSTLEVQPRADGSVGSILYRVRKP
ncbi:MAG: hypothetical protein EOP05_11360 [Proteobacteria bacterium]|nr:MAG: hypothetical protein EOP05_11360 [Pseudomonadota bacterium]